MRKSFLAVLVTLGIGSLFAEAASAQTSGNVRLLLHGTSQTDSTFGVSGWVIAPNVTNAPDKWLAVIGPRYNGSGWWLEVMGGTVVQQGKSTPLIDVRANLGKVGPFTAWTNVEWIDFTKGSGSAAYLYFEIDLPQIDVPLIGSVLAGLETENLFEFSGNDDVSAGIHLKTPLGKMVVVTAYQLHFAGENQLWTRVVIDF